MATPDYTQQLMAMPMPQANFAQTPPNFIQGLGGALFPASPGMDPQAAQAAQAQALMQMGLGIMGAGSRPGATLGGSLFEGYGRASQNYTGAMDQAFRNTLVQKESERQERADERQKKADERAERQDTATTAGRISSGLGSSKDPMSYWNLVKQMPEVQDTLGAYGIDTATITTPEQLKAVAQQFGAAGQIGGPALPRQPLNLKAIMGPAGKPILVPEASAINATPYYEGDAGTRAAPSGYQWTSDGLAPIPGGPADMTGPGARRVTQPLRKEFRGLQSVKDYETALPLIKSAEKAPDDGYGDLQLIYSVGKILDPGSVVREGELHLTLASGSPLQRIIGTTRFTAEKGGRLTPQVRQQILGMLNERVDAYQQAYDRDYNQYSEYAREMGIDPEMIVGSRPASAYEKENAPARIQSGDDYNKLPSGAQYIGPDGSLRQKR